MTLKKDGPAVMPMRNADYPKDLDYYPTPPFATKSLCDLDCDDAHWLVHASPYSNRGLWWSSGGSHSSLGLTPTPHTLSHTNQANVRADR